VQFGEVRRVVTFNLNKVEEREMYEFSKMLKFGPLVKRYLREELKRKRLQTGESSITVQVGDEA